MIKLIACIGPNGELGKDNDLVYSNKEGIYKTHDTWNKIDWFKFNHCLIGTAFFSF